MLYQLEEEADRSITHQLQQTLQQQTLQEALDGYKAMCAKCDLAMHRHHRYSRALVTKYGELHMRVPIFRCGDCGEMSSGMELIGEVERRKRFSKKRALRR